MSSTMLAMSKHNAKGKYTKVIISMFARDGIEPLTIHLELRDSTSVPRKQS